MSTLDLTQTVEQKIEEIEAHITADDADPAVYEQAILDFSMLLNKQPFNSHIYRHRGHRYLSLGHVEQAVADLSLSTRMEPEFWKSWDLLGMAYYFLGDFEKALTYYRQGLQVTGPKSKFTAPLTYWSYLSLCRLGRKDTDEAQRMLHLVGAEDLATKSLYLCLLQLLRNECTVQDIYDIEEEYERTERTPCGNVDYLTGTYGYGIAMKYYLDGQKDKARDIMEDIVKAGRDWNAWGHIACQKDLTRLF